MSEEGVHEEDRGGRHGGKGGLHATEDSGGTSRELRQGRRRQEESVETSAETRRGGRRMRSESQSEMDTPMEQPK